MIFRAKAPLRLGLAGGGTDVAPYSDLYGGYVLNAAIDLYAYCTIEPLDNNKIIFVTTDRDEYLECETKSVLEIDGNFDLHKGAYNRIIQDFNQGNPLSFKMTTYADAPAGSGLGTSSTMEVVILAAFKEWLKLPLGDYDIAQLAYQIERVDLEFSGGKQDQYAATFGGFNFMEFFAQDRVIVNPLRIKTYVLDELESSILLFHTGTSRQSANIIKEQIKNTQDNKETALNAMHAIKADALVMKEAILKGDIPLFAQTLNSSWLAKKKLAKQITNPWLDEIYEKAMEAGAYAGKISGAGGGGFMILITDPVNKIKLRRKLSELEGGMIFNFHFVKNGVKSWQIGSQS